MATRPPVLLVDQDPGVADSLSTVLSLAGYNVRWARTGDEALEAVWLARNTPVVLLDSGLPDMTAAQFGARLHGYHSRPVVILMTDNGQGTVDEAVASVRAAATLRKPFAATDLLQTVESTVAQKHDGLALPSWVTRQSTVGR
jgi:two-component system, OmpR family, catabolic regulation response regulator CreB